MRTECTIPTYALTKSNIEIVICRARKTKDMPRISSQLTWLNLFGRLLQTLLFTFTVLYFIFYGRLLSDTVCCCLHKILSFSQYSPYCVAECPCRRFSLFSAIAVCATPSANALVGAWHHFGLILIQGARACRLSTRTAASRQLRRSRSPEESDLISVLGIQAVSKPR